MPSLIEPLIEALKVSDWPVFLAIIAIALIINLRRLSEFLEDRATRHQRFVQEALKLESLNQTSKLFLEEELNYFIFKRITGISADAVLREKLQNVISRSGGELQIRQFSRARDFVRMKGGKLQLAVTTFDIGYAYVNLILGTLIALMGLALFTLPILTLKTNTAQTLMSAATGAVFFTFAMFMVAQAFPALQAKRLAPIVERLEAPLSESKIST